MAIWFLTIGGLGIYQISKHPGLSLDVAVGFNPMIVFRIFTTGHFRGIQAFKSLGGVVLCVLGSEALYADMGHVGAGPISLSWCMLVYPCLVLQYMGRSVVIMIKPGSINVNPLYITVPASLTWPVSILAVMAAIIALQALI